jgi:AraC family transcriptional regulator of adaptative response/methylated-DNA-[protein]-cysteine methyltransferase
MNLTAPDYKQMTSDYLIVERAIGYMERNYQRQPTLEEVANSVGFSQYHFQRLFSRWVGISPKRFLQFLTKEHAKQLLERNVTLLDVAFHSGLSGPGRLHDLFVTCEAVTPGEYKLRGCGLSIHYGFHHSPFGECLIAVTERGVCSLIFLQDNDQDKALQYLESCWRRANIQEGAERTSLVVKNIFSTYTSGEPVSLPIFLSGTNFQLKVWEALLQIPAGSVVSYQDIARRIGAPDAYRAVGSAVAQNPIPVIIPCHRVIRKMGAFGGYRWGASRKKAILGWEMAKSAV